MLRPDISINVRFLTPQEGGRSFYVQGEYYGCPIRVGDHAFDCRLLLYGKRVELGRDYTLNVKMLDRVGALRELLPGRSISLLEGKVVATGTVAEVFRYD